MWVSPPHRRARIAARLIDAVIGWARETDAKSVELWVTQGNDAAARLYEGLGLPGTDEHQPLPSDPGKDELRMRARSARPATNRRSGPATDRMICPRTQGSLEVANTATVSCKARDWGGRVGSVGRIRGSGLGLLGAAGLVAVTGVIGPAVAAPATNVIVLPGATSAEGIAVGRGSTFYAGDLFGGDIFRGDLQRGTVERFIDTPPGQMSVGLKVDDASGLLFVAGGFSGQGFVYDALTGAAVATYQFGAPGSRSSTMWWSPEPGPGSPTRCRRGSASTDRPGGVLGASSVLTVTGPAANTSGEFNLNGIAATPDGRTLIVAHSTAEALYTVDPVTGASRLLLHRSARTASSMRPGGCGWRNPS